MEKPIQATFEEAEAIRRALALVNCDGWPMNHPTCQKRRWSCCDSCAARQRKWIYSTKNRENCLDYWQVLPNLYSSGRTTQLTMSILVKRGLFCPGKLHHHVLATSLVPGEWPFDERGWQ